MICRLCLKDMLDGISIFGDNKNSDLDVSAIIAKHFWFEPKVDDPISTGVCTICWQIVESFHHFYVGVEEAHRLLSERFYLKVDTEALQASTSVELVPPQESVKIEKQEHEVALFEPNIYLEVQEDRGEDRILPQGNEIDDDEHSDGLDQSYIESSDDEDIKPDFCELDIDTNRRVTRQSINKTFAETSPTRRKKEKRSRNKKQSESEHKTPKSTTKRDSEYNRLSKEADEKIANFMKLCCEMCGIELETFAHLKSHFKDVHSKKGYVVCCNKKLFKRVLLVEHINRHLDPEYFKCHDCNKSFADKQCLKNHMLIQHQSDDGSLLSCDQCPKKFAKRYLLEQHRAIHTPLSDRKFICECGKAFPNKNMMETHKKYVHLSSYGRMCHICAKVIRGKSAFEKHQLEHSGVKQPEVQCDKCGAWLKNKYSLQKHIRRHNDEGITYVCDLCGKVAPNSSALRSHFRYVHASARTYKCGVCDKAFKKPINLREHMTTHTGEVLYSCPYCPKTFNSNANMHSHRKKAHPKEWEENRKCRKGKVAEKSSGDIHQVEPAENETTYETMEHLG